MSQAPITNPNSTGSVYRAAQNATNAALASDFSGSTAPASPSAYQYWLDTSGATPILKQRNTANSAWVKPYFDWASTGDMNTGVAGKIADAAKVKAMVDAALALVDVGLATAALDYGDIGSYAFLYRNTLAAITPGATYAGSTLRPAAGYGGGFKDASFDMTSTTPLSGTWRAMGGSVVTTIAIATLFLRIA